MKKETTFDTWVDNVRRWSGMVTRNICKAGRDDPRSVIHALKVGFSLTLVSMLYLLEPLFGGIGESAIYNVVVVLEFTAGATLRKRFNRGLGTLCAGSLVFFLEFVADKSGRIPRAIFIGIAVFLTGAAATYMRFFPHLKKNYDYGIVIFLLTFNLIAVSSFRVHNILEIAHDRFYTIAIGCGVCLLMSLLVFPNWSGLELHNSTVSKLEGLAESIEACVNNYFEESEIIEDEESSDDEEDPIYRGYKLVLDSKTTDETLALHASWEPKHSCYKSPWKQYVKSRCCTPSFWLYACCFTWLLAIRNPGKDYTCDAPRSVRDLFKAPCTRVAREISKTFKELADSIRNKRLLAPILVSDDLHEALQDLNNAIKSQPRLFLGGSKNHHNDASQMLALAATTAIAHQNSDTSSSVVSLSTAETDNSELPEWKMKRAADLYKDSERKVLRTTLSKLDITSLEFSEALPFAAFASLLIEMAARRDMVTEQVEELGRLSKFKDYKADQVEIVVTNGKNRTVKKNREFGTNMGSNEVE
ncbi:hypothetical protein MKX01_041577 [Papaver californicum]|nr:hypothetical protein MKX01_041577 [Papaver californicum]